MSAGCCGTCYPYRPRWYLIRTSAGGNNPGFDQQFQSAPQTEQPLNSNTFLMIVLLRFCSAEIIAPTACRCRRPKSWRKRRIALIKICPTKKCLSVFRGINLSSAQASTSRLHLPWSHIGRGVLHRSVSSPDLFVSENNHRAVDHGRVVTGGGCNVAGFFDWQMTDPEQT